MLGVRIEFTQSARRHRIGRARATQVVADPIVTATIRDAQGRDDRLLFIGEDSTGRPLEVMAVAIADGLLVIHVMDLRPKWRRLYEEGRGDGGET